jgi:hypothetical protein
MIFYILESLFVLRIVLDLLPRRLFYFQVLFAVGLRGFTYSFVGKVDCLRTTDALQINRIIQKYLLLNPIFVILIILD